jgi:Arc/MetJ-type ribon-helix-helix transcriptional regulator
VERKLKRTRNIRIPDNWQEEIDGVIREPDAVTSASGFIRAAIREKLDRVQTAKEMREIEERQAATFLKILAIIERMERAIQTHIAFQDAFCKVVLTQLPEPTDIQAARQKAQDRYEKIIEHAARQLATNGNGKAN